MAGERTKDALASYRKRYREAADRETKGALLDEFCATTKYHRKYATALLNRSAEDAAPKRPRRRRKAYSAAAVCVIEAIWKAAGRPWSVRLKALLPLWMPWARLRLGPVAPETERQVLAISARQIDRRLAAKKRRFKRGLYGRTKPGTLLRREIPVKVGGQREVAEPGWAEIDLVSHSGPSATGEFAWSLNLTDVLLGWCETRAVLGRGEEGVVEALEAIRRSLPFRLLGIHSDNGSEFINHHLRRWCRERGVEFTRSRPNKKDDNARVEQKNWTHVRRVFGWDRYDAPRTVAAMNALYEGDLRLMMNLFQPSVRLVEVVRDGPRLTRRYDAAKTPLDRLADFCAGKAVPEEVRALLALREGLDPFGLAESVARQVEAVGRVQEGKPARPATMPAARRPAPPPPPLRGGRAAKEEAHAR